MIENSHKNKNREMEREGREMKIIEVLLYFASLIDKHITFKNKLFNYEDD